MSSRHRQTYIELNSEKPASPPDWAIVVGVFFAVGALWLTTAFLFSL